MIVVPDIQFPVMLVSGSQLTLTNATIDYNMDRHDHEVRRSVINGDADIVSRGEYFDGRIDWHFLAYTSYTAMKALQGTTVRLWPFGTGAIGTTQPQLYYPYVDVLITSVRPYHRNTIYVYDAAIIEFVSKSQYTIVRAADTGIVSGN